MASNSAKMAPPRRDMQLDDLPDSLMAVLFAAVPARHRRRLPLVCKRWQAVCNTHPEVWKQLHLDFSHIEANGKLYKWCVERRSSIQHLKVVTSTEDDWLAVHLVLGLLAGSLEQLTVRGKTSGVGMQSVAWLSIMSSLKVLDMQYDDTDIIENCAVLPSGLEALTLRCLTWQRLRWLPPSLARLKSLRRLVVQGLTLPLEMEGMVGVNSLVHLTGLTNLEHLELKHGHIGSLPAGCTALHALTSLRLWHLSILSDGGLASLASLTGLRELDLFVSALSVPHFVTALTNLRRLAVAGNRMQALPEGRYLRDLTYLDISCNAFSELPPQLSDCTALEYLRMDNNRYADPNVLPMATGPAVLRQLMDSNPYLREIVISEGNLSTLHHAQLRSSHPKVLVTELGRRSRAPSRELYVTGTLTIRHYRVGGSSSSDDSSSSGGSRSDGLSDWGSDADHTGSEEEDWLVEDDGEAELGEAESGDAESGDAEDGGGGEEEAGSEGDDLAGNSVQAMLDGINGVHGR